mmetsp:Transcript_59429/g.140489  ORF Transcript_59429/g.140489 Transcript_59429/m.140489 type:complete len:508 (-) Transcript_59429:377-1900(-)
MRLEVVADVLVPIGQQLGHQRAQHHAGQRGQQASQLAREAFAPGGDLREEGHPHRNAGKDREDGALRRRAAPVQAEHQRHEGRHQRDLVGRADEVVDRGALQRNRVGQHREGKDHERHPHRDELLLVAHLRPDLLEDVLDEAGGRRQQRGRGGALDRRQQRAEEQDLHDQRHVAHHKAGQHPLVVVLGQLQGLVAHHAYRGQHDEHRHEGEGDVAEAADHGATLGGLGVLGRHHALEHVLLRNRAQHHRQARADEHGKLGEAGLGQEAAQVAVPGQVQHLLRPAGQVGREHGNDAQADDQHDHLDEVRPGHGQEAANDDIDQHRQQADDHAGLRAHRAVGQDVEDQAQRRDLGGHPAQVAQDDGQRAEDLDALAVALAVEVADGQQVLLVELGRKEGAHQHQAQAGAEGVLDDGVQAALNEFGRQAHHGLGAEPGREGGGHHHDQRQAAAGDREIAGVLDPCARPDANTQRAEQVEHDENDQRGVHGVWPGGRKIGADYEGAAARPG